MENDRRRWLESATGLGSKVELETAVKNINRTFKKGGTVLDVLGDIRKFPRPIAVDFNNVIANNRIPLQLNPYAPTFLQELRQIGNVFIVTSATGWANVQRFLKRKGLCSNDIVLMTNHAYAFMKDRKGKYPEADNLKKEFLAMAGRMGWRYKEDDLFYPHSWKVLGPIFAKPYKVPIIDDSFNETDDNPGMYGINVQAWECASKVMQKIFERDNVGKPTLGEAIELVRKHYASIESTK